MTTIAYRDGIMAADGFAMIGGWRTAYALPKLFRLKDGSVCGVSGDYSLGVAYVNWLDTDRTTERPDLTETSVIQMTSDALIAHEVCGSFPIIADFGAWGSGSPPAYGALHAGADALLAVEIASRVDPSTGVPFICMKRKA